MKQWTWQEAFAMSPQEMANHLNAMETWKEAAKRWQKRAWELENEVSKPAVALGRLGGLASKGKTSEAKKKASRENGKKGGWPKGKPRKVKEIAQ